MTKPESPPSIQRRLAIAAGVLLVGFLVYLAVLLFEEFVSADMRWGLWLGSVLLFAVSATFGKKGLWVPLVAAAPLVALHGLPIALDLPSLWAYPLIWLAGSFAGRIAARGPDWATVAAPVALTALFLIYGNRVMPRILDQELNSYIDEPAPLLVLEYLDGTRYPVDQFAGNVVVLDFFATWCIPCRAELPEIEQVRHAFADRDDIIILVVGDGDSGDTPEQVAAFAESAELDLPFAWDPGGATHDAFGFWNIPALAVIDRKGNVRLKRVGYNAAETSFQETLTTLLESL